jgi:hypothetical protein
MIQVAYTNSNCSDLWDAFQKQTKKHTNIPLYMISDKEVSNINLSGMFVYKNEDSYYKVWIDALSRFNSEYFIYLQEDFFLYSDVNHDKINEYVSFLKNNPEYSFVRLIKSGQLGDVKLSDTLYEIEPSNPFIFAMQATIWRTADYIALMETVKENKWLETIEYQHTMNKIGMKGVYHYDNEPKRGGNHYDTNVYPYIATALVKGKWIMSEYSKELSPILSNNNIDQNIRGVI